jgi:hypothetical protein
MCLLVSVLIPFSVSAQTVGFNASSFQPATGRDRIFTVEQVGVSPAWTAYGHLLFHGERDSLRLSVDAREEVLVAQHWFADINVGVGLWDVIQLDVSLPVALAMSSGENLAITPPVSGGGLGDLSLGLRAVAVSNQNGGFGIGLSTRFSIPTGDKDRFRSDSGGSFYGALLLEYAFPTVTLTMNIGTLVRYSQGQVANQFFSHELAYAFGLDIHPWDTIALGIELFGRTPLERPFSRNDEAGLEAIIGPRWFIWNGLSLDVGIGAGLVRGRATPDFRFVAGFRWAPSTEDMSAL